MHRESRAAERSPAVGGEQASGPSSLLQPGLLHHGPARALCPQPSALRAAGEQEGGLHSYSQRESEGEKTTGGETWPAHSLKFPHAEPEETYSGTHPGQQALKLRQLTAPHLGAPRCSSLHCSPLLTSVLPAAPHLAAPHCSPQCSLLLLTSVLPTAPPPLCSLLLLTLVLPTAPPSLCSLLLLTSMLPTAHLSAPRCSSTSLLPVLPPQSSLLLQLSAPSCSSS